MTDSTPQQPEQPTIPHSDDPGPTPAGAQPGPAPDPVPAAPEAQPAPTWQPAAAAQASSEAWPGWAGGAPPAWTPAPGETGPRPARRRIRSVAALMLLLGVAAGSAVTAMVARGQGSTSGVATIKESTASPPAAAAGDAENVAHDLAAAVGTVVARGSSSSSLGSGFVISHDDKVSYALTNNHVVDGAKDLFLLMPDGHNLKATLVGTDTLDDLAVISVANTALPVATFGDSSQLKVGQAVIAIGSPLGNEGSVTRGVISAVHRTIQAGSNSTAAQETLQDVLQTDASINRGNSGGPLADASGRVVGVNVAIAGDASNIGFSIPSNLARGVAETLMRHQKVQHPYLGVKYLTTIEAFEENRGFDGAGVLIDTVSAGSPAEKAGFHTNDILQAVNGVAIDNGQTLGGLIQGLHVGDSVTFTVRRGDQQLQLTATLVDRPAKV